jgi:hypothetical protein
MIPRVQTSGVDNSKKTIYRISQNQLMSQEYTVSGPPLAENHHRTDYVKTSQTNQRQ